MLNLFWWSDLAVISWIVIAQWATTILLRLTKIEHGGLILTTLFIIVNILSSWWMHRQIDNQTEQNGRFPTMIGGSLTSLFTTIGWLMIWVTGIRMNNWVSRILIALYGYTGHIIGRNWALIGLDD